MNRTQFIDLMNGVVKLIRSEYGLTQEKMATLLGLSKKTLVEIEKGRSSLGWTGAVACASLFSNSPVLVNAIGSDVDALIWAIAFQEAQALYPKTLGGKVWWKPVREAGGFRIQQNLISHHYRLLDAENRRRYASFVLEEIEGVLAAILEHEGVLIPKEGV
jgi:DNA-binding XRE family transcriptional regulator